MERELTNKLNILLGSIKDSLNDIKRDARKGRTLKKTVSDSRQIVTEVLEQQLGGASLEEQINISQIPDDEWLITTSHIIELLNEPFIPVNRYDTYFLQLFNYLKTTDVETLVSNMMFSLKKLEQEQLETFELLSESYNKYEFDGAFDVRNEDYSFLEDRADFLKKHSYDLMWLFTKLGDYESKRTLSAILMNWTDLQTDALISVRSMFKKYFDPDIFPSGKNEFFFDIGANKGETIESFVNVYGTEYKRITAYEISGDNISLLDQKVEELKLHDVTVQRKSVGATKGKIVYKEKEKDAPLIRVAPKIDAEERIDSIRIDDEKDPPTFIKIGAAGNEKEIIEGCKKTIKKYRPKLAISNYHSYDDIWRIPHIILEICPDYKLYLRYYGGHLLPTDYVLYCKPVNND